MGRGENRVAPGRVQEIKQEVASRGKLQNDGGARGRGIELLLSSVSLLQRENMPYEIMNEDKTNVGERLF